MFVITALYDLELYASEYLHPVNQLTSISAIGPNELEVWVIKVDTLKQKLCTISILDICFVYQCF